MTTLSTAELAAVSGDVLQVALFCSSDGSEPSILLTVNDADETLVPTARLTWDEGRWLQQALGELLVAAHRKREDDVRRGSVH